MFASSLRHQNYEENNYARNNFQGLSHSIHQNINVRRSLHKSLQRKSFHGEPLQATANQIKESFRLPFELPSSGELF